MPNVEIFVDGACSTKPKEGWGNGGFGIVAYQDGEEIWSISKGYPQTTNNRMELIALYNAIRWAMKAQGDADNISIFTDSSYCEKGYNSWMHGWAKRGWTKADGNPILNPDIWKKVYELFDDDSNSDTPLNIKVVKVKGHSGIKGNERADELACAGRDSVK